MFIKILMILSKYAIPILILFVTTIAMYKGIKVYEVFTEGATEGFYTAIRVIPYLLAMLVAIGIFRASGAMDILVKIISPITNIINMPSELLPMAIMRPLSGSGAMGILNSLLKEYGADSLIGRMASIMSGATDTTFYILAVYFGAVGIKNSRYALKAGLIADAAGLIAAVIITNILF